MEIYFFRPDAKHAERALNKKKMLQKDTIECSESFYS